MYQNLILLLKSKKISNKELASLLSVTEKTIYNKIAGETEFTYSEIRKIKKLLPRLRGQRRPYHHQGQNIRRTWTGCKGTLKTLCSACAEKQRK